MPEIQAEIQTEYSQEIVPTDFLAEWIKKGTLLSLIVDAVQSVEWPESEFKLTVGTGYSFRRLVMLTVLTYCYANGICDAGDIALKTSRDEVLRCLCAGISPTSREIRSFRRHNCGLIRECLIRSYKSAHEFGLRTVAVSPAGGKRNRLRVLPDQTEADLEPRFAEAAETQIELTAHLDAVASEE
ncbi:MAG TPA: hypothetical protein VEL06_03725 [Haliangiales bacterium]|nr:hypothetical protein [Haliangiales bacterium]